jgi:hypothetical protein
MTPEQFVKAKELMEERAYWDWMVHSISHGQSVIAGGYLIAKWGPIREAIDCRPRLVNAEKVIQDTTVNLAIQAIAQIDAELAKL